MTRGEALGLRRKCVLGLALLLPMTGPARANDGATPGQDAAPVAGTTAAPQQTPAEIADHLARVQQTITRAEQAYARGVTNYRAGHVDAARDDFDAAIDLMLSSGMDLKNDSQLADEFDHLSNAINSLEMTALKQGTGFGAPIEAAPLENATDQTFGPNPELVAKLKTELSTASDLPLVINDQVAGYIGVFSNSESFRRHMAASLQRVGKYRGLIQEVLKEEGVPQDLIYLAVAESGFEPQALNTRSGAGGMWQFMSYTGPEYGLTRNGWFDYRFDPEKSTRAYAQYIKKLYGMMGDWYLAMAAFDWGPGKVQLAVQRTGYADFWELYRRNVMPAETKAYVPKILAAVLMAKNPERYGLNKLVPSPPVIYDTITTDYGITLRLIADITNVSVQEIEDLNPALLRLSTPNDVPFDLHIPPGTKDLFEERLKEIPTDKRTSWRFHVVRAGETLETVASDLHARVNDLVQANGLSAEDSLSPGDELVVPLATAAAAHPQHYTAQRGDTLVTVADRFNVSVDQLRRWNHLSTSAVRPGRTLLVTEPLHLAPTGRARSRASHSRKGVSRRSHTNTTSAGKKTKSTARKHS